jgi:hypothetical protein
MYDPKRRDEVAAVRLRGAVKANKLRFLNGRRRRLDNHAGLAAFVTGIVYDVARTALYGASTSASSRSTASSADWPTSSACWLRGA